MPFINDRLADIQHPRAPSESNAGSALKAVTGATASPASRFLFDPAAVMARLRSRIVGQDAALTTIDMALKVVKADIGDPRRPLYVALFVGPTGVGKTEVVRVLAEAIHGQADAFCRIDMNTLAQDHYAAAITGAPPGYVGSKEGTTLLDAERIQGSFSRPGIVLFDEIEKAGQEVIRTLLNVLDNGQLTLTSGAKTIDFRNSLIFMTSNLGAHAIRQYEERLQQPWRRFFQPRPIARRQHIQRVVDRALQDAFDPEFINRLDRITLFNWIEPEMVDALIDIELSKLNARLARKGYRADLHADARQWLKKQGFERRYGARSMGRTFRNQVALAVAQALANLSPEPLLEPGRGPLVLQGSCVSGRLCFKAKSAPP